MSGHHDVYANEMRIQVSQFDFTLDFNLNEPSQNDEFPISPNRVARIRVSPQLAKQAVQLLLVSIAQYEQQLGPIPIGPDFADQSGIDEVIE